jgi:hypothetical protein
MDGIKTKNKKIHGWLLVALILLSGGALRNLYVGVSSLLELLPAFDAIWLFSISSLLVTGIYELYMVFSFIKFKPDSVFLGKSIFFIVVFQNVLRGFFMQTAIIHAIIMFVFTLFQAIWFFYLVGSTQVAQLYPKENRRASAFDYTIFGLAFSIPIIILLIGIL